MQVEPKGRHAFRSTPYLVGGSHVGVPAPTISKPAHVPRPNLSIGT